MVTEVAVVSVSQTSEANNIPSPGMSISDVPIAAGVLIVSRAVPPVPPFLSTTDPAVAALVITIPLTLALPTNNAPVAVAVALLTSLCMIKQSR